MDATPGPSASLTWTNVALGFGFILFNASISTSLHLGVGSTLLTAAFRCIVQLAVMALVLQNVFETNRPWVVGGIAFALNFLGTFEAVTAKSSKRYDNMFLLVLMSMLASTIPVSIIGARYAMGVNPFWVPNQYIPMLGMLCGNTISGVVVATTYVLKDIYDNRDRVETYLAFGASRFEACLPIARDALRLALTPIITQTSVIGIIYIPGMMTGAILGGASIEQAAKLQIIIMFMITASTTLATIITTVLTLHAVVDTDHRVRLDRIHVQEHVIWRTRRWMFAQIIGGFCRLAGCCYGRRIERGTDDERKPLLS